MEGILRVLPDIISYLIVGFCFIQVFRFVYSLKEVKDTLTSSLIYGFAIVTATSIIPSTSVYLIDMVGMVLFAVILAYIIARILKSQCIQWVFDKLHIPRTLNHSIWNDLLDSKYPMKIQIKIGDKEYVGIFNYGEENTSQPLVALSDYSVNGVVAPHNKVVVLDTAKADEVSIVYSKESHMVADLPKIPDDAEANYI